MKKDISRKEILKESFLASIPIFLGYIPLGLICGIMLQKAGLSAFYILMMSLMVFAGSSQFVAASMLASNGSITSIVLTTFILNLRNFLMSSNLHMNIKNKNMKFLMYFCHGVTDETFAINLEKYTYGNWTDRHALYLNNLCVIVWAGSCFLGAFLGEIVSISDSVAGFLLTAMFITLAVNQIKNKVYILVSILSILLSIILYTLFKSSLVIIIASIFSALFGFYIQKLNHKKEEIYEY
ncbi:AzlC family ABC transporter permease [Clostridioides sp. ZZV15-6383]|uniref:AzlC family ABC transporter permease n=1 Tax=unclassified Clostridioides TaxID=2635829 RepID=UPI001D108D4E